MYSDSKEDGRLLLPLSKVGIKSLLRGPISTSEIELTYVNSASDESLECTYTFPLEKGTVLAKFEAVIDDKVVTTKVTEKEQAEEMYDTAMARGHAAVMAQRTTKKEQTMTIKLG